MSKKAGFSIFGIFVEILILDCILLRLKIMLNSRADLRTKQCTKYKIQISNSNSNQRHVLIFSSFIATTNDATVIHVILI